MNTNKFSIFILIFISLFASGFSINVCGVSVNTANAFVIEDNIGNKILAIDSQGNVFMQGQDHISGAGSNAFKSGFNEFSYGVSKTFFSDSSQDVSSLSAGSALIIEDSSGSAMTKLFNSGGIQTKGKIAAEGSQANCNPDGWGYCNADNINRESRSYSCDITGTESGSCIYSVDNTEDCSTKLTVDSDGSSFQLGGFLTDYTGCSSGNCMSNTYTDYCSGDLVYDRRASGSTISSASFNCNLLDYFDCSGSNRRLVDYTCGGSDSSGCTPTSSIYETCMAPSNNFDTWSCSDSSTAQRLVTTYAPTCTVVGSNSVCGSSSSTFTDTDNCPTSDVCKPTDGCTTATFSWETSSYSGCDVACGSGTKYRSVWCEREDGLTVSDSYCGGVKPGTSTSCSVYPANHGDACSDSDSCGSNSGTYVCNGAQTGTTCDASSANFEPWNYGNSCSESNACGDSSDGTYNCNSDCSVSAPDMPSDEGDDCTSSANTCGSTSVGTMSCGTCSATTPAMPSDQGDACTSSSNSCGMTDSSGTLSCGVCSSTTPSDDLCIPNIDCVGGFVDSGSCSLSCGGGNYAAEYVITTAQSGTGSSCSPFYDGYTVTLGGSSCNTQSCIPNVDCVGYYTGYGSCSSGNWNCGGGCGFCNIIGSATNTFVVTTPQSGTGAACPNTLSHGCYSCQGCFVAKTQITLFDGSTKNIEEVKVGDKLKGSNGTNIVIKLHINDFQGQIYSFNGENEFVTAGHPFKTIFGWKAIDVETALILNPTLKIGKLEIGDMLISELGLIKLNTISGSTSTTTVFNFKVSGSEDYYADGYLVHNK